MSMLSLTMVQPASLSCQELSPLSSLLTDNESISRSDFGPGDRKEPLVRPSILELKLDVNLFLLAMVGLDRKFPKNPLEWAGCSWSFTGGSSTGSLVVTGSGGRERGSE